MNWRQLLRSQFQSAANRTQRRQAANRRAASQNFEVLEQRTLLAGDVTATLVGQTAFLTGDNADNNVQVTVQDGHVIVQGLEGTTINGSSDSFVLAENSSQFGGSLIARMGHGNDEFDLSGVALGGLLRVFGGTGDDTLSVSDASSVGRGLLLHGQSGANSLAVSDTDVGHSLWMIGGRSNDVMAVANSNVGHSFVAFAGRGNDDIVLQNSTFGRDVWVSLAHGNDDFVMTDSSVASRLIVHGGRGDDMSYIEDSTVGRVTRMHMGAGRDRVSVLGNSELSGRTVIAGGRKSDLMEVADTATISRLRSRSIAGGTIDPTRIDERITGSNGAIAAAAALVETAPALQLSVNNSVVSESAGNGASELTITRTTDNTSDLEVTITSSDTSRLQPASTTVTIPAGQNSASVLLNVIDDTEANGDATVTLTASAADAEDRSIVVTVSDDESSALTLSTATTRTTEDENGTPTEVLMIARRTGSTATAATIDLAYTLGDGSDASSALTGPATVTFAAGSDSATFTVTTVPNSDTNDDVKVTVTASNSSESVSQDLIIEDDDKDRLTVRIDTLSVVEDGPPAIMTISRTSDTTEALDVTIETSDSSRIAFNDQSIIALTIPAGATSVTQQISAIDNSIVEGNLTVTLTATAVDHDNGVNTVEVVDNDTLTLDLQVNGASEIAEDAGTAASSITVSRNSADISNDLEITINRTGDDRLSAPTTVTIPAGQVSADISIDAIDNNLVDNPETGTSTFVVSASGFPDATINLTVTNDDVASTAFDPATIVVSEDQGTAQITMTRNNSVGTQTVSLAYSDDTLLSGPASVEFADGATSLQFNATIVDNDLFTNNATVTVTGTVSGQPDVVLNVEVANDDILAVTTDFSSNRIEETVGGFVTRDSTFTVTGVTEPNAGVAIDSDGDGEFDDGSTTADSSGNYSVDVTLTHTDDNRGVNRIQAQASLPTITEAATSTPEFVHLALGTLVRFETNQDVNGDGTNDFYDVELLDTDAPNTVANFLQYVNDGSYENNIVHRSVSNFVIQGGGFRVDNQTVSRITTRAPIADEFIAENSNIAGTLSMAHAGPNTGTSQWFVNVSDNTSLDTVPHTVFGRVIGNGIQVAAAINSVSTADVSLITGQSALGETPLARSPFTALSGSVAIQENSTTLTGTGTSFTTELQVGDIVTVDQIRFLRVTSIQSDTEISVDLQASSSTSGLTLLQQNLPQDDDYFIFSNIGEILDVI